MKNIIWIIIALILVSCETEKKDYFSIEGKVKGENLQSISVQGANYSKSIPINNNVFSDTLHGPDGIYALHIGSERFVVFLKKGDDLNINFEDFESSNKLHFSGIGAETNILLQEKRIFAESEFADPETYFILEKEDFTNRISEAKNILNNTEIDLEKVDSTLLEMLNQRDRMFFSYLNSNYEKVHTFKVKLAKGKPSPVFENYENFAGGSSSLSDYKGNYVYIDIWATWCGPCKAQIPFLKNLEKDFHGKNIKFISISVDNVDGRRGSYESWKKMVKEQQLGGVQLFADNDFNSTFIREYDINSIPRFILIDPEGNIIDADAIKPSNPSIKNYFEEIGVK